MHILRLYSFSVFSTSDQADVRIYAGVAHSKATTTFPVSPTAILQNHRFMLPPSVLQ